jgi:hypothetical protein
MQLPLDIPWAIFSRPKRSIDERVHETARSVTLRAYGAALVATHLLTLLYFARHDLLVRLVTSPHPICWQWFSDCDELRTQSATLVRASMVGYGALAVATLIAFARPVWTNRALVGLVALNLWKAAWILQDYRLMGNYHYMPFIASAAYLLLPRPKEVGRYLLVAFYVSAGVLKLNREWLSGAALIAPTWLRGRWLEAGCTYVVLLELVLVFGLLAKNPRIRWLTLSQFVVFHAYSWHVVGFFYPLVMFCLLSLFPLLWLEERRAETAHGALDALVSGRCGKLTYAALGVYALAQAAPAFFPGDSAITGEGRVFAINMMDARVECDPFAVLRTGSTLREVSDLHPTVGIRIRCDPVRYLSVAKNLCRETKGELDTYLLARRTTDATTTNVFALEDLCAAPKEFASFAHNDWIGGAR